jgi:hypothetical protein
MTRALPTTSPRTRRPPSAVLRPKSAGRSSSTTPFNGETTLVATTTVLFGGTWNVTLTKLDEGVHVFKAAVQDLFGNPSALSDPLTIEIDTITPTSRRGLAVTADTDSGLSNTDGITNDTTPTIAGQAPGEEGSVIHLYICKATCSPRSAPAPSMPRATGPPRSPRISPREFTTFGPPSRMEPVMSARFPTGYRLIIDTNAPAAPTLTLSPASDSGSQGDGITNDTTPTLRGATEANARVHVFDGSNVEIGTAIADATGSWNFTVGTALPTGSATFTAKAEDVAGNLGPASGPLVLTINANNAPGAPTLDANSDTGPRGRRHHQRQHADHQCVRRWNHPTVSEWSFRSPRRRQLYAGGAPGRRPVSFHGDRKWDHRCFRGVDRGGRHRRPDREPEQCARRGRERGRAPLQWAP